MSFRVIHICEGDYFGGAAIGANNLHQSLLNMGIDSTIFFSGDNGGLLRSESLKHYRLLYYKYKILKHLNFLLKKLFTLDTSPFSFCVLGIRIKSIPNINKYDLIHLHNVNNFIHFKKRDTNRFKLIWTIRDLWPITGGCHAGLALNCEEFLNKCENCLLLKKNNNLLRKIGSFLIVFLKEKKYYNTSNIHKVAISGWLFDQIPCEINHLSLIYNSICFESFKIYSTPCDYFLKSLNLKNYDRILCIGGYNILSHHKGGDLLYECLIYARTIGFKIISFGQIRESKLLNIIDVNFGIVQCAEKLSNIYSFADVYLTLSRMDTFGKTVVEAMACGTPVVCFNNSGPGEIVNLSKAGIAVPLGNIRLIKNSLSIIIKCEKRKWKDPYKIRSSVKKYENNLSAHKYSDLYTKLLLNK